MQEVTRRIVSLWLPHWPVERLARHTPNAVPADRPFALVESSAHGLSITAVNHRAARDGIRLGASLADARAALPELVSRPAEPIRDHRSLIRLARWLGRYGPARNRDGIDGVWIDITGVAHLFGGEEQLLADLIQRLSSFGITPHAGLAGTLGAAHALARFSATGRVPAIAPPNSEKTALAALPIAGLRLEPDTVVLLKRLGLRRIGQLYDVPRAALEQRFHAGYAAKSKARDRARPSFAGKQDTAGQVGAGQVGAVLTRLDQMLGLKAEPRRPLDTLPALSVRRTWAEPLISAEALDGEIAGLVEELCDALKAQALGVRQLCLTLYRADGTIGSVQAGFCSATCEWRHMMRLLREKLSTLDAGFGIDMTVLDGHGAERTAPLQTSLGTQAGLVHNGAAVLLIDRLSNRLGANSIYGLAAQASHIPERAQSRQTAGAPIHKNAAQQARPGAPRPAFLLQLPEPIRVMAEVPEGIPKHFIWRRVRHLVVKGEGPERIEPEWWRGLGVTQPNIAATRDYYHLENESGARFWVFRAGLYQSTEAQGPPRWFVHGLFG